jgi:hypothetical protein
MSHQQEYEREVGKLKDLVAERERITMEILAAQRRVMAWATLLDKHGEDVTGMEMVGAALRRGRLTDAIRQILTEAQGPLGTNEIVSELRRLGFPMEKHTNPAATVNAIGNRLIKQAFARVSKRPGKKGKAWERVRKTDLIASLKETDERTRTRLHDATASKTPARKAGVAR